MTTLENLLNNPKTKFVKCRGFNEVYNPQKDRDFGKGTIDLWSKPENRHSYAQALTWGAQDFWVGMICPEGCIIMDIDDKSGTNGAGIEFVEKNLDRFGIVQKTKNGYHVVCKAPKTPITGTSHPVQGGFSVTFRTAGKFFVCCAPTPGYEWIKKGEISEFPEECYPAAKTQSNKSRPTNGTTKKSKIIRYFGDLKTVQKHIYKKYGYPTGKISQGTFDLLARLKKAKLGTRYDNRNKVAFKFVAWAKGGSVQWAEFGLILAEAVKTSNTLHPQKSLRQMAEAFEAAIEKARAEEYIPARKTYDARQVRVSTKNLIKTKAKEAGPNAEFVVVTAEELASIAPLNSAPMQNILKKFRFRTATRNIYIFPILRSRPKGIRAMFTASIVPVLIKRTPKTSKPAKKRLEALRAMYSRFTNKTEKENWELLADEMISCMKGPPVPVEKVEPTPSPPIAQPGEVGFDLGAYVRAKLLGEALAL